MLRKKSGDTVPDNLQNRRKGWRRITLFAFYFRPSAVDVPPWKDIWQDAKNVSQRNLRNYFGFFPFHWKPDWEESYELLTRGGEIFCCSCFANPDFKPSSPGNYKLGRSGGKMGFCMGYSLSF